MKKITLKIDGKEQTFNEGSVVEVVAKKQSYQKGKRFAGYLTCQGNEAVPVNHRSNTGGIVRFDSYIRVATTTNDWDSERIFESDIKSIKELGEYTAKDIEKAYDKGVSDCDRDGNPPEHADRIKSIRELK